MECEKQGPVVEAGEEERRTGVGNFPIFGDTSAQWGDGESTRSDQGDWGYSSSKPPGSKPLPCAVSGTGSAGPLRSSDTLVTAALQFRLLRHTCSKVRQ